MVEISEGILELVVDIVLVRDQLANSGTNLSWKMCQDPPCTAFALAVGKLDC
ncbi:uncharacterized protein B0I36DRAFT_341610 [Microdochium trichocladiopsis]|uniref:Uncharacterized protein n=1 Tax=Microdochium trichocladiopsis TaxID=1682393 RepID=A0A9P8XQ30_9PEZI|nr:uncharacterized protein B0I36DRAFT_341610 [Microdochium trichocladiopsis]KAH7010571.1 hypothetical protein B0I36DRAFT_341610 [Microdochium trichocladiopsis]